ncbi:50S ribosomal protein L18 [Candidatus Saccharibacteria bacterium]|nr:50S ribosomal protein L18 [Candidatus Saccharibacteria bacterium]
MSRPSKLTSRLLRKQRVRARVIGSEERPRLSVFISNRHVSAQVINDATGTTLASATTLKQSEGTMTEKAAFVGTEIAKKAKEANVTKVVFDRNGQQYAGRLKALADAARKEGLEF